MSRDLAFKILGFFVGLMEGRIPVGIGIFDLVSFPAGKCDGRKTRRKEVCALTVEWRNKGQEEPLTGRSKKNNNICKHDEKD